MERDSRLSVGAGLMVAFLVHGAGLLAGVSYPTVFWRTVGSGLAVTILFRVVLKVVKGPAQK